MGTTDDDVGPVHIRAQCWQGALNQRPSSDNVVNVSVNTAESLHDVNGDGRQEVVASFEVPDNPDVVSNRGRYSCIFGFQQEVTRFSAKPGVADLFSEGESVTSQSQLDNRGEAFIVSGSNEPRTSPISIAWETMPHPDTNPQNTLEQQFNDQAITEENNGLWQHYPREQPGAIESEQARHPLDVYNNSPVGN